MISPPQDLAANVLAGAFNATTAVAADDTLVLSDIFDRKANGTPLSAIAMVMAAFTSASGAAGGKNTLAITVESSENSDMSSPTSEDTLSYEFTWAADGENYGHFVRELDMSGYGRYVRLKAKLTEAGTITISLQKILLAMIFGGSDLIPNPGRSASGGGYSDTTEPSA